jgi:hypothetical protein
VAAAHHVKVEAEANSISNPHRVKVEEANSISNLHHVKVEVAHSIKAE